MTKTKPATRTRKPKLDMPRKVKGLQSRAVKFVSGEHAEAWLAHDEKVRAKTGRKNRPVTKANVKNKFEAMCVGMWKTTSQGITVDWDGSVIDGQHTLNAIVNYGNWCQEFNMDFEPITIWVTEGEDPDNFPFYDQGKNRSLADVLEIDNVDNARDYANALRLLWLRVHGRTVRGGGKLSPYQLKDFGQEYKGMSKSSKFIASFGETEDSLPCRETMSPGYAIALHYLMENAEGVENGTADQFWTVLIEQEDHPNGEIKWKDSPMYKLSRYFKRIRNQEGARLERDAIVDLTVSAFNAFAEGTSWTARWNKDDRETLGGYDGSQVEYDGGEE